MQRIMEPLFEIAYLITAIGLGVLCVRKANGRRQHLLFGTMAIVLGCGDAFHLVPRIWYLLTTGTTTLPQQAAALGFGKMVTSITMTVFYLLLYHVWQQRYYLTKKPKLTAGIYFLAAIRVFLCVLPQNQWLSANAPLSWGIYRNIPFLIMGAIIIALYYTQAKKAKDKAFGLMWLAITLSFALYIPVVLFADKVPAVGLLMIPKTCAYVWIIAMGYADVLRQNKKGKA